MQCDKNAKKHMFKIARTNPCPLLYQARLPKENIRKFIGNKKLTSMNKNDVHERLTYKITMKIWIKNG